jgi:hypothetical protein
MYLEKKIQLSVNKDLIVLGMLKHAYNSATLEAEAGGWLNSRLA